MIARLDVQLRVLRIVQPAAPLAVLVVALEAATQVVKEDVTEAAIMAAQVVVVQDVA